MISYLFSDFQNAALVTTTMNLLKRLSYFKINDSHYAFTLTTSQCAQLKHFEDFMWLFPDISCGVTSSFCVLMILSAQLTESIFHLDTGLVPFKLNWEQSLTMTKK